LRRWWPARRARELALQRLARALRSTLACDRAAVRKELASPGGLGVEVWSRGMPCKVIPFPVAGKAHASAEPVIIRRRIILHVGGRRYDVDLIGLVRPMSGARGPSPPTQQGLSAASRAQRRYGLVQLLEGSQCGSEGGRVLQQQGGKREREEYRQEMGIGVCSPAAVGEAEAKFSLAFPWQRSDPSSCANRAQKETDMTNQGALSRKRSASSGK
jgi:hypothetical protein